MNHKSEVSQLLYCDGELGRRQIYTGLAGQLGSRNQVRISVAPQGVDKAK